MPSNKEKVKSDKMMVNGKSSQRGMHVRVSCSRGGMGEEEAIRKEKHTHRAYAPVIRNALHPLLKLPQYKSLGSSSIIIIRHTHETARGFLFPILFFSSCCITWHLLFLVVIILGAPAMRMVHHWRTNKV